MGWQVQKSRGQNSPAQGLWDSPFLSTIRAGLAQAGRDRFSETAKDSLNHFAKSSNNLKAAAEYKVFRVHTLKILISS